MNVQAICHAFKALEYREENVMPKLFEDMSGPDQFVHLYYYFLNDEGRWRDDRADDMRKALNDHLNPYEVHRAFKNQDGTKLLQLIHTALGKHLAAAIDKENENEAA